MPNTPSPSPQFARLLDRLSERVMPPVEVQALRDDFEATALSPTGGVRFADAAIGGVSAERATSASARSDRAVFYVHGGGYSTGSPVTYRKLTGDLAQATSCPVLVPDYPLAPEHPFPRALHALIDAYVALVDEVGAGNIALAGDSAGGGLCVSMLVALRDAGRPLPCAVGVISPWADLRRDRSWLDPPSGPDPMVSRESLVAMRAWYLGASDGLHHLASPVLADLAGLPPILIHAGSAELLLSDALTLAERAASHGVWTSLEVWPNMIHNWHFFAGRVPESTMALARFANFLRYFLKLETNESEGSEIAQPGV